MLSISIPVIKKKQNTRIRLHKGSSFSCWMHVFLMMAYVLNLWNVEYYFHCYKWFYLHYYKILQKIMHALRRPFSTLLNYVLFPLCPVWPSAFLCELLSASCFSACQTAFFHVKWDMMECSTCCFQNLDLLIWLCSSFGV